ncbi:MAG TPA: N-6 DNA methylase, partial [Methanocella sp.]|nr:N-6 DNA methylase [Methanocella sp.]
CSPGLKEPVDPCAFDALGRAYESMAHANGTRKGRGEFYTPPFVVDYMVGLLDLDRDGRLPERKFIDIACGPGAFLVAGARAVIRSLRGQGMDDAGLLQVIKGNFFGLDISPAATDICKINLYLVLLDELGPEALLQAGEIKLNVFVADAIDNRKKCPVAAGSFDYVLGNPPYLEAKKMPAKTREACRDSWPQLKGAFDLYVPFVLQCNRLAAEQGKVCLILPDKFTVARYGTGLRAELLRDHTLLELADLSGMDIFTRAMVYPAVIAYENSPPAPGHRVRTRISVKSPVELTRKEGYAAVPQGLYLTIGRHKTLFCLPQEGDLATALRRIFDEGTPIGELIKFRSTVSFHKKGLRERFVRQSFDGRAGPVLKYLGGESYARKNEVDLFRFRWAGYHIDYDQEKLKEQGNVLPPLANFRQEKIVLCQHARRLTAAYDGGGEFVTKDVYPIGIAAPGLAASPFSLKYFTALLNSELMSFVYGTVYKGIQIGGGYYHYLPTWLDVLPVIAPERRQVAKMGKLADRMMAARDEVSGPQLMGEVDDIVYRAYGITDEQREVIRKRVPAWPVGIG